MSDFEDALKLVLSFDKAELDRRIREDDGSFKGMKGSSGRPYKSRPARINWDAIYGRVARGVGIVPVPTPKGKTVFTLRNEGLREAEVRGMGDVFHTIIFDTWRVGYLKPRSNPVRGETGTLEATR